MENAALQQEAKELLNSFLEQKKISKVKLAKKIGISHAVLTYVSQEQWENVSDEMLLKIVNTLKVNNNNYVLITTSNFNTVLAMCKEVSQRHYMYGLIGCTGAGKTTALKQYYKANANVYYVECKNTMNRKQFFAAILKELGIDFLGTVYDMLNRIIDEFKSQKNPLLIIDEAGKLSHNVILDLHDLRNDTMNSLGIILAGCEYFKDNLEKDVRRNKQGLPEFYSRLVGWQTLSSPSRIEVETIFKANGIENIELIRQPYKNFRDIASEVYMSRAKQELDLEELETANEGVTV